MEIDLNDMLQAGTEKRATHLHIKISRRNKLFLKKLADGWGIPMGLLLDKLLTTMREDYQEE